ncbi:hypothetical protein WICANDRAFT_104291 [Wickerhamomyces anomalus NRRL Y-366-8]|uniref:Actin cortical patch SUR7/pH-response regulator PalI n=1 Tax=Wickerhamomyces anomalus (strain ATCC 58044 / CBS 1984 / NCYC 433 / NRRL Y-366-8) TaxID=683960 RepID=A0A1E3P6W8_WICAA|nr:uncharacterized protein WICANDRAFT_104291 [Wickerhamomyces anomalus NRRL Y-366-8]ODQ61181.1 hypothetical protein WICANDRAFT_104291 [Wickerhamomyces anomalus NRRL Y-366-8]
MRRNTSKPSTLAHNHMGSHFTYKFFNHIVPALIALSSVILLGMALSGQTRGMRQQADIYLLKFDFSDIREKNVFISTNPSFYSLYYDLRYRHFAIGPWGYCKSKYSAFSSWNTYCYSRKAPYQYDLYELLEDDAILYSNRKYIDYIALPENTQIPQNMVDTIFVTLWISTVTAGVSLLFYFLSFITTTRDKPGCTNILLTLISAIASFICGGVARGSSSKIIKTLEKTHKIFGITATLGNKKFYNHLWAAGALQIFSVLFVLFVDYKLAKAIENEPDEESTPQTSPPRSDPTPTTQRPRETIPQRPIRSPAPANVSISIRVNRPATVEIDQPPRYEEIDDHHPPKPPPFTP